MTPTIYTKEFGIGEILSEAWQKFAANFQLIALITLIVYIPVNLILALVPLDTVMAEQGDLRGLQMYWRIIQLLEGTIGVIATMAIATVVKAKLENQPITLGQAFKKAVSRWWPAISTNIVLGIFVLGLSLLLIVPGVIFSVYWTFALYAVSLQDQSGKSALDYSKAIVKGRWWKTLGYSMVFGLLTLLATVIVGTPHWFLPDNMIASIATDTLIDLTSAFFIVVTTVFFINFDKTKKETPTK